jgi:hypothetical protein
MKKQKGLPTSQGSEIDVNALGVSGEEGCFNRAISFSRWVRRGVWVLLILMLIFYLITGKNPYDDSPTSAPTSAETPVPLVLITRPPATATPQALEPRATLPLITLAVLPTLTPTRIVFSASANSTSPAQEVVSAILTGTPNTQGLDDSETLTQSLPDLDTVETVERTGTRYWAIIKAVPALNTRGFAEQVFMVANESAPIKRFAVQIDDGEAPIWYSYDADEDRWTSSPRRPTWIEQ